MNTTARPAAWWARTRLRLQVPQTKQLGWPLGKAIVARRPSNVVRAVTTGSSATPSASSAGSMKKPNPSETISIGIRPPARAGRTARTPDRAAGRRPSPGAPRAGDVDHRHLELHQPPRAHPARVVGGDLVLPDARHVLGHDGVRDVGQGDRPVVVDEDGQRRLPGEQRRDGRRRAVRAGHRSPAAGHRARPPIARAARRPLGHEPRRRSATPARMTTPPTTWIGRIARRGRWPPSPPPGPGPGTGGR